MSIVLRNIAIYVNKGSFATIHEAACAEQAIDWADETDGRAVACTECFAAIELYDHLGRVLDAEASVSLHDAGQPPESKDSCCIRIGSPSSDPAIAEMERNGLLGFDGEDGAGESFCIRTVRQGEQFDVVLAGAGRTGTLYAVYAFLEAIGFRWYAPGETIAPRERLSMLPELNLEEHPHFRTRGCYSEFIDDRHGDFVDWMARNRMNYAHLFRIDNAPALKKRGIRIAGGGHDILYRYLDPLATYPYAHSLFGGDGPADPYPVSAEYAGDADGDGKLSYAEAHPDWFALADGKRTYRRSANAYTEQSFAGDNYCLTHPGATAELANNLVLALAGGELRHVDDLNFWLLDNGAWCECEGCLGAGNRTSRLIGVVHQIRQAVVQAKVEGRLKRNVRILFPAYHETLEPPDRPLPEQFDYAHCFATFFPIERCYVHTFNDPGCTETNAALLEHYASWMTADDRHYRGELAVGEYYSVRTFAAMPVLLSRMIAQDIPYYYETGTRHFYYMHMTAGGWGMLALNNSLYARLLWDANTDSECWTETYFGDRYGKLAVSMREFYGQLERAGSNMKLIKHYQEYDGERISLWMRLSRDPNDGSNDGRWNELFPLEHLQYDVRMPGTNAGISFVETLRLFGECRILLDRALLEADEPEVIERLLEVDVRFEFGWTMLQFYERMMVCWLLLKAGKPEAARVEFTRCRKLADQLKSTTEPLRHYHYSPYYESGFTATWIVGAYERLARRFA